MRFVMKRGIRTIFVLMSALAAVLPLTAEASARIDAVEASVSAPDNLPPLVQQRMQKSVAAIASQLIEGRGVDEELTSADADAAVIHEVFDKVLVGYTVEQVGIEPGETARVSVTLVPWDDTIQQVHVTVNVDGMSPEVESLVRRDIEGVDRVFDAALTGLPIAASDWTNGVLKQELHRYMQMHLPEFIADFDVKADRTTDVQLTLYPQLPVVRTVDLSMRSDTVPNMTLLSRRPFMQDNADELVGVPVAFVTRHKADFETSLASRIDALPDFRQFGMKTHVAIAPAERLHVMSRSDTSRYRLRLDGWTDIGRGSSKDHEDNKDLVFRLHAGTMLSQRDELYLQLDVMPQQFDWDWQGAYRRTFGRGFSGDIRYDARKKRFDFAAYQELTPLWMLRYEYRGWHHMSEAALRYKVHDFLSLEYVIDRYDNWMRVIGHF